jgi:beta-galactosidase GanA
MRGAKGPLGLVGRGVGGVGTKLGIAAALLSLAFLLGGSVTHRAQAQAVPAVSSAPVTHTISYDKYSLMIDGKRTFIWSGEFHYWRLPSPSLWLDVLEKMKAEGYNAVSIYFNWAYHSPAPGVYDFSGVRDVNLLLDDAAKVGLYVIARPGPYINAETSGGGLPGWLTTQSGRARTNAPDYEAAADDWLSHIDAILKNHQLTNGTGTVILYQIENELASTGSGEFDYMQNLYNQARSDGITVPIFHNDKGRNGIWVPAGANVPGTVTGPNDLYAFDGYPGAVCTTTTPPKPNASPDWGIWGTGGATGGASASPNTPGFLAENGGGWFDFWGSPGTYNCMSQSEGPGYERVTYGTNIANRITLENFYMTFGGTSWGWLPAPVVYTSYDYGAAISEARQLRPKVSTMKELGLFLQSVAPVITKVDQGAPVTPSSTAVKVDDDVNNDTGTHFYFVVHNPSNATTDDTFTFPITTSDGTYTIPQDGTLALNGQDAKMLVADYDMDGQHLVYSTSEIMTHFAEGSQDVALLYGRDGEDGETVLRYSSQPTVNVVSGNVSSTYDPATGDLRLDYVHNGLAEVQITGGGRPALSLLLADNTTADTFWRQDTDAGPVLEQGPELVRTASVAGSTLNLTGDTSAATTMRVWAPGRVQDVTWNGQDVGQAASGAEGKHLALATAQLPGPAPITLPDLSATKWRFAPESPEAQPSFDDSGWQVADKTTTNSTTKPPAGQPVLTADDYGFHQGDVWYRASYSGASAATTVTMRYGGGGAGMLQAWLDGVYLGQNVLASNLASPPTTGTATFPIPTSLQTDGPHTLAVMVRNDGHNEDGGVNDAQKEGRGLISVAMTDANQAAVNPQITWRIQGDLGGENIADPARGVENNGGLYGERHGWYLPGYPDGIWATTRVPATTAMSGTSWYRTTFNLHIPKVDDASLGITIGDPSMPQSSANYRALIFVNGWNMGQYIANVGPQHTFVVPNGVLNPDGSNTLAIAVTSNGGPGNGLEKVALTDLGTVRGGVPVTMDRAQDWNAATWGPPTVPNEVAMDGLTGNAASPARGGDIFTVTGAVANLSGPKAKNVSVALDLPAGWTASPSTPTTVGNLAPGASQQVSWTVTIPDDVAQGSYTVAAIASYRQGSTTSTTGASYGLTVIPKGLMYISDLPFVSAVNGFGPVERDENVGGSGADDGGPLSIDGVGYAKGLGTNAISSVVIDVPAGCTTFSSDVGVDDSAAGKGSVTFSVLADGVQVASTGVMRGGQPAQHLTANVTGVSQLTLNVGDAGDGIGHDNGDWGDAELMCAG